MGLFDKFRQFRENRRKQGIKRNQKTVQNAKAIKEDRLAALDFFKDHKEAEVAVPALLCRFEYSLDHSINDTREKELSMEGILQHKEKALPFLAKHIKESSRIAWSIKAYKKIASKEEASKILEESLVFSGSSFDQQKTEKNYDILCYLRDYKLSDTSVEELFNFLEDPDERVRFAVLEVILEQDMSQVPKKVERFLLDESAENIRLRQTTLEAFIEKEWTLTEREKFSLGEFMPGIEVSQDFKLKRKS